MLGQEVFIKKANITKFSCLTIFQWLDLRTRRVLRAVHPVLRQNIENIDSRIFQWSLFKPINPKQLIQFSLDVGRIEGKDVIL